MLNKRIILLFSLFLGLFTNTLDTYAQCGDGSTLYTVDLTGNPDGQWVSPSIFRDGPGNCVKFSITLDPAAVGINFNIIAGAIPSGALTYQVNCGPPIPFGQPVCLSGVGPHILTFCKPGNNTNTYQISSIGGVVASSNSSISGGSQLICEGGTLNLTASSIPNGVYTWTGPNGFTSNLQNPSIPNVTLAAAGTYTVAVNIVGGCSSPLGTTTVGINPTPATPVATSNGTVCEGGTINLSATSIAGATYAWTGPNGFTSNQQNPTINGATVAASGTYSVSATVGSCTSAASTVNVKVNPTPIATATPNIQTVCSGNSSSILLSSNSPNTTFTWTVVQNGVTGASNGSGTAINQTLTNTGITAGTATYTIIPQANGCPGNAITVTITVNPTPSVASGTANAQTICSGSATSIPLTSTLPNTTFTWTATQSGVTGASNGSGTSINQTLSTTSNNTGTVLYTVTPNSNGCNGSSFPITVTVNPIPTVNNVSNITVCAQSNSSAINFGSSPSGATFTWTNSNTSIGLPASGNGNLPAFTAINNGSIPATATITVTPTLNGCSGPPSSFVITVNPLPTVTVPSGFNVCTGSIIPSISFSSNPSGASYVWTNSNPAIGLAANGLGNIPSFTATNTSTSVIKGTITVTPILNGCNGTPSTFDITVNPLPTIISVTPTGVTSCTTNNGSITINASGNLPLEYSINGGLTYQSINSFTGLTAGSYSIAVKNAFGCIAYGSVVSVSSPTAPPTPVVVQNSPICEGSTLILSISSPNPSYIYTWTGPNGYTETGASVSRPNATIDMAGNYAVTATQNGCVSNATTFTVTINQLPTVSVPQSFTICNNTNISATSLNSTPNGASFSWTNSNPSIGLAASGNGNIPAFTSTNTTNAPITGTITVTPTLNGCPGPTSSYDITVNPKPVASATPTSQTVCSGTAPYIQLSSNIPNTTFTWTVVQSGVSGASAGSGSIINQVVTAASGTAVYTVTPTANGCSGDPIQVTINVNPVPVAETTPSNEVTICSGSTTNIPLISNINNTVFSWTVNQIGVIGGSPSSGNSIAQTLTTTSIVEGKAIYTITPRSNGCDGEAMVITVTVKPLPQVVVPSNLTVCEGTTVSSPVLSSLPSGATYNWTNSNPAIGLVASGGGDVPSFVANNNTNVPITGTITVTPSLNGCDGIPSSYNITVNPLPQVILPPDSKFCVGSTVPQTILTSLPSGATYTWTNSNTAIGLPASGSGNIPSFVAKNTSSSSIYGIITVTPSLNGCYGIPSSFIISVNPLPNINVTPASPIVCSGGSTTMTASGASSYFWSPTTGLNNTNSATVIATPATTTTYTVTGIDANGCSNSKQVTVTVSTPVSVNATPKTVSCKNGNDGEITLGITGGTAPYLVSYSLNNGPYSNPTYAGVGFINISNLAAGSYNIKVTDRIGCFKEINTVVTEPDLLTVTAVTQNAICKFSSDGKITLTPNGGTQPYNYYWTNFNNNSPILDNIPAGTYSVTVVDAKNCSVTVNATVAPGNCSPVAKDDIYTGQEDTSISGNVGDNDQDPDKDVLNYFKIDDPANGSITFNSDGSFVFTPNPNWNGSTTFTYRVCDPYGLCSTAKVTLNINPVNDPPIARDDRFSGPEDTKVNGDVTINDKDPDDDKLVYTAITNPQNGSLTFNSDGTFVFTPDLNWFGSTSFDYKAIDPYGLYDIATVYITITPVNDPPVAVNDTFYVQKNFRITETVANNDYDVDNDVLLYQYINLPTHGTLNFNSSGYFTYIPNPNYTGKDSFSYKTCDPYGLCDIATVTLIIQPIVTANLIPEIDTIAEGQSIKIRGKLTEPLLTDVSITLKYAGTAAKDKDYTLADSYITLNFKAGQTESSDFATINTINDAIKENIEDVLVSIRSTSSPFVLIGTGSDIAILDVYPDSIPTGPDENPDINPDPLTSPNGDGIGNEAFVIYNIDKYPDNEVLIFNRWGNAIFRIKGYDNKERAFRGFSNTGFLTNTNLMVVDGVYYYLIYTKINGVRKLNKGYIILKR
nr:PKD-like domain-containing protein [Pelobium sp.]